MSVWKIELAAGDVVTNMKVRHNVGDYFDYKDYSESLLAEIETLSDNVTLHIPRELALWLYS